LENRFFVDVRIMRVCLWLFCLHLDDVIPLGADQTSRFRGTKFYWIL